ncbi:hypothetical protein SAMN04488063_0218 [Halopelagius inordinatus]|uniref:Uncharacterized protein n=1 Tax=Halopelagius inordinatus TaxID=553467 RepID=A0A1I2LEZ6_9EURY|nr:hypothetical protein [Halopelagius inordinatus]SFF77050.1 hypothetical protein SAMN04488063_0218 [Halopelagius inordinatus]
MQRGPPEERPAAQTEYGEAWVYESIVGALPGIELTDGQAIALQLGLFQLGVFVFAWVYDLWGAVLPGTIAVAVAAVGSVVMLRMGRTTRRLDLPEAYGRMLFGSSIEVVLGVLAFVALVTHLFVFEPRQEATPLVESLFGTEPPIVVVYLMLLVLWDLCYRIGTSWWAAVVAAWRSRRYAFDESTATALRRVDAWNVLFGLSQLALLPFLTDRPVLLAAVGGHVVAVSVVSAVAAASLRVR